MSPITRLVGEIGGIIDKLTLPVREKRELEAELQRLIHSIDQSTIEGQASVIREESRGNWLQRSWRPLIMLIFAFIILAGTFTEIELLSDTSRFWDLLEIGLGGYVVGRSGEKIVGTLISNNLKKKKS